MLVLSVKSSQEKPRRLGLCRVRSCTLSFAEGRFATRSFEHFKSHFHQRLSIGAVAEGTVEFTLGEKVLTLREGSLALINPHVLHACNPPLSKPRTYGMLYLDTAWCASLQGRATFAPFESSLLEDASLVACYFDALQTLLHPDGFRMEKEEKLTEFFGMLLERVHVAPKEPNTASMELVQEMLASNLEDELPLETLAHAAGIGVYGLIRAFKASVGTTPHAFRLNCRIEVARHYLQQGHVIAEVAQMCGFYDQSHFHHHFKAFTTQTPKAYQRNFLQDLQA